MSSRSASAILLLLAALPSHAMRLDHQGFGQVLIFPFYTVDEGFQSLLTISNTTDQAKALNLRFREGSNHRSVLDFHLYLKPRDTWTAALFSIDDSGEANLLTRDRSCTVPDILGESDLAPALPTLPTGDRYVPFQNRSYTSANDDAGPDDPSRTRQGMVEVIEMGVLTDETFGSAAAAADQNCNQLNSAWVLDGFGRPTENSYWVLDPAADMVPPSGGLSGSMRLVAALAGIQVIYKAEAIRNFSMGILNTPMFSGNPNLSSSDYDPDADGFINTVVYDSNSQELIHSSWSDPTDAVSALFMNDVVENEIVLDRDLAAVTEWIVSFPTKQFYTDPAIVGDTARVPFAEVYDLREGRPEGERLGACEYSHMEFADREGNISDFEPDLCFPGDPRCRRGRLVLCRGSNLIAFHGSGIGGLFGNSSPIAGLDLSGQSGQFRVLFGEVVVGAPRSLEDQEGRLYFGLPVVGFSAQVLRNGSSFGNGVLANYGSLLRHGTFRRIQ